MSCWLPRPVAVPPLLQALVCERGSLTRALRGRFGSIEVTPVCTGRRLPTADEARALGLAPGISAYLREVILSHDGEALVFARTVMPAATLVGRNAALRQLARNALGDKLFDGRGERQQAWFGRSSGHCLLSRRWQSLQGERLPAGLPSRRSRFLYRQRPLLVQELFLPAALRLSGVRIDATGGERHER